MINDNKRLFNFSMESIVREKNSKNATALASIIDEFPEFRLLRKLYYLIELMYTKETFEEAEAVWNEWVELLPPAGNKQYKEWCDLYSVEPPLFDDFRTFVREGFQRFKPYILNYFKPGCRHTNAATEGLNNLIGSINRVGNGYKFKFLRAKCLYASLIHERISYGIDTKTIKKWKPTISISFSPLSSTERGAFCDETIPHFTSSVIKSNITPINIYDDNEILLKLIETSVVGENIPEKTFIKIILPKTGEA